LFRLNGTLLNPNYRNEIWSQDEEKKLVLCMKAYRDNVSPIVKAGNHFPDRASKYVSVKWNRSLNPKYTTRRFTPSEDAALLQAVQKAISSSDDDHHDSISTGDNNDKSDNISATMTSSMTGKWMSIAKQFPNREPRVLQNRWLDIVSDKNVLRKKFSDDFKANFAARKGVIGKIAAKTTTGVDEDNDEDDENAVGSDLGFNRRKYSRRRATKGHASALLSPDDLMVRVKKRRKVCDEQQPSNREITTTTVVHF